MPASLHLLSIIDDVLDNVEDRKAGKVELAQEVVLMQSLIGGGHGAWFTSGGRRSRNIELIAHMAKEEVDIWGRRALDEANLPQPPSSNAIKVLEGGRYRFGCGLRPTGPGRRSIRKSKITASA